MMKNKKKIFIIVIAIILACGLWALGYMALKNNDQRIRDEALFDNVSQYVKVDTAFSEQYGDIETMYLYQDADIIVVSGKQCQVPCIVIVEDGKSYLVWVDYDFSKDEDQFTYISVELIGDK